MSLQLDDFLMTGRTFEEYVAFFDLDATSMKNMRVLDCPSGASSFIAEAKSKAIVAQGCDILYCYDRDALRAQGEKSIEKIYADTSWMADNNFDFYHSIERHKEHRVGALEAFCVDYNTKDYWFAELPKLPYADNSFDLVLSSHLLFVYDDRLDLVFHEASIAEMLRISKEVRIFPLVDYKNSRVDESDNLSPFAYQIVEKFGGEIVKVGFEFQKNAGYMLKIKR
jgi:SAM-dependent methyltransferase